MESDVRLLDREELAALGSPLRRRMLDALQQPGSASSLAREMDMSRQRIGYHMRELEKLGFIESAGERSVRGCTEKLFRVKAITYILDPQATSDHPSQQGGLRDRYSWSALMDLAGRMLKDLTRLRRLADASEKRLATLSLETEIGFIDPAQRVAFTRELTATVNQLVARYHSDDEDARRFRLMLGAYPSPPNEDCQSDPTHD